jgi:hypothetical protein
MKLTSSPCCKNLTVHSFVKLVSWSQSLFIADTTRCCRTNEQSITHTSCREVKSSRKLMGTEVAGYTTKIIFPYRHISQETPCLEYPFTLGPILCFTCRDVILSGNRHRTALNVRPFRATAGVGTALTVTQTCVYRCPCMLNTMSCS